MPQDPEKASLELEIKKLKRELKKERFDNPLFLDQVSLAENRYVHTSCC